MATEIITIIISKNGKVQEAKSFVNPNDAEDFFAKEANKRDPLSSNGSIEFCIDNGYFANGHGEEIYLTHNDLVATEVIKPLVATYEIKASTLKKDVIRMIEGIIDLTPVDPEEFTWLLKMETLTETLNDDGLDEGYEDAFKEEWTQFVKECENSGAKYVLIDGKK